MVCPHRWRLGDGGGGIPAGGANRGLEVTLPGGRGNRASYVTDATPNGETGYHASFSLNAGTLTSGSAGATVLTLFEGRTAAGGQVFAVQFHRLASGVRQVRTVMSRSGTTALTGAWVDLPSGAHTIAARLDVRSRHGYHGRLAQAAGRRCVGAVQHRQHRHPAGRHGPARRDGRGHLDRTSTMAGTAYVDSFVSTRYTLP